MIDLLSAVLIILTAILWAWALLDITKTHFEKRASKWMWIACIWIFPILGSIVYFQLKNKITRNNFKPNFEK